MTTWRIYEHQSYVWLYYVVDGDGYIVTSGLTRVEAEQIVAAHLPKPAGDGKRKPVAA